MQLMLYLLTAIIIFSSVLIGINYYRMRTQTIIKESDHGRMFGWTILLDGKAVASLEYRLWDSDSQFWHIYEVRPLTNTSTSFEKVGEVKAGSIKNFDINALEAADWINLTFQSRYSTNFTQQGAIVSLRENNCIAVRGLSVPENILKETEAQNSRDQNKYSQKKN